MNIETLENILKVGETTCIEFKRAGDGAKNDTFETVCSFLNRLGGDILLGVADDGEVIGIPENSVEQIIRNIINVTNDSNLLNPSFYVCPEAIRYQDKTIIHIHVPQSSEVHRFKGVCYDRAHEADVKVTGTEQIAQMYIRKQGIFTERRVYPYVKKEDLRLDLLPKIRNLAASRNPEHPWLSMSDDDLLRSAKLISRDYVNNTDGFNAAAVLLLGKDLVIQNVFPAYKTDAIMRKVNVDRYDDRVTVMTNLIESYEMLIEFGIKHLPEKFFLENDIRINLREKILREMIGNVLIHREYTSSRPARFIIEKDQMFTDNANKALNHGIITLQNLCPVAKNPIIAAFFNQIGRADELGSGVRNLYKYVHLYSGADPIFDEEDVFKLTVPLDDAYSPEQGKRSEKRPEKRSEKRSEKSRDMIIRLLQGNPSLSASVLAEKIGITQRVVERHISKLKADGILFRNGADNGGCWVILSNDKKDV